jgi:hypothetical protein
MHIKSVRKLLCLAVCALSVIAADSQSTLYTVDGQANVVGVGQVNENAITAQLPSGSTYTFTLTDSDYRDNSSFPTPQRFAVIQTNSGEGDLRTVALNGIGDSQTIQLNSGLPRLFIMDTDPASDNSGSSTIEVRQNGSLVNTYTIDGINNIVGGSQLAMNAVIAEIPTAGYYRFTLTDSDFRENGGAPVSAHVIGFNPGLGDFTTFTLNGIGDAQTFYFSTPDSTRLFFIDDYLGDNVGRSIVDVQLVPEPATMGLLALGGIMLRRRMR